MNDTQITFCGWVGSEVTLTELPQGGPVASFRVGSTPRRLRRGQWEDGPTAWYTVKAWRGLAEHVAASVRCGDPVVIHGKLVADVWTREDGSVSTKYVVVATSVGHDLNRGTTTFVKAARRVTESAPGDTRLSEVIHSYDDSGPRLDEDGEVISESAA
jgi:single-strand DNA-binding protein